VVYDEAIDDIKAKDIAGACVLAVSCLLCTVDFAQII
jgi:hypothetical protein